MTRAASRAGSVRESRSDPLGLFILCRSHWRAWALLGDGASPRWGDCRGDPISGPGRVCGRLRLHPCGNRPRACGRWLGRGSEAIPTSSDGVPSGNGPVQRSCSATASHRFSSAGSSAASAIQADSRTRAGSSTIAAGQQRVQPGLHGREPPAVDIADPMPRRPESANSSHHHKDTQDRVISHVQL